MSARRRIARWFAGLLFAGLSVGVQAAVTCTVSATGPAFGIYNPLTTSPTLANGQVSASCTLTGTTTTTVSLVSSYSAGSSGTYAARTMLSGVNALSYNLYYDAAFSQVRGDGTGGSQTGGASFTLTRTAPTQTTTSVIYGRIPALQDVAAGSYLDTIVFTVTY
jgi:spore coat protein U-like protein